MYQVSIVIVSYNTPQLLEKCIQSIYTHKGTLTIEIIVVDNAPGDGSEEIITPKYPDVAWINSGYNAGYSRGNNIGIKAAQGEYVLLLNPDAFLPEKYLNDLLEYFQKLEKTTKVGLLTSRIISSIDQQLLIGSGIGFIGWKHELNKNPFWILMKRWSKCFDTLRHTSTHFDRLSRVSSTESAQRSQLSNLRNYKKYNAISKHYTNHEIDFASGACVLFNRIKLTTENLLLDDDFFLYWEDVEWSFRLKKNGYRNFFCGELEMYHVNAASTGKSTTKNAQIRISEFLYYFKRYNRMNYYLFGLLIRMNFSMNCFLLKRKKRLTLLKELKEDRLLFSRYYYKIPKIYSKNKTTPKPYFKYAEQD